MTQGILTNECDWWRKNRTQVQAANPVRGGTREQHSQVGGNGNLACMCEQGVPRPGPVAKRHPPSYWLGGKPSGEELLASPAGASIQREIGGEGVDGNHENRNGHVSSRLSLAGREGDAQWIDHE